MPCQVGRGPLASRRPVPTDIADLVDIAFLDVRGTRVRVAWGGRQDKARGTILVLPGRGEFLEKYAEAIEDFSRLGYAAAFVEWRGQGRSDRLLPNRWKGHVRSFEDYLADLDVGVRHFTAARMPEPWLLFGHSMGGHLALRALHRQPDLFRGAVLSAPMFGIDFGRLPPAAAWAICSACVATGGSTRYAPGQADFDPATWIFEGNPLTTCSPRYEDYTRLLNDDPELGLGGVTYGWVHASLRSMARATRPDFLRTITAPVTVLQAGAERIVSNRAQSLLTPRLRQGRLVRLEGARHDLLLERDEVRATILDVLGGQLGR